MSGWKLLSELEARAWINSGALLKTANVRFWHLADIVIDAEDVAFGVEADVEECREERLLLTQSGHFA